MAFPLTEEQKRIVDDRDGELLVSAAAGSGKTRVLVERLLDQVTQEGVDLDRFLVITFTKAVAAELRTRIAQELSVRLAAEPQNRHLRRQAALVYRTQISTIHSFCTTFLREEGHRLDLNPDFRQCDEGEAQTLMLQVLEDVVERQYEGLSPDSSFGVLVDTLSAGRDDRRLLQIVLDVYGKIQSHPDPEGWLREQRSLWELEGISNAGETVWGRSLLQEAARQGRENLRRLEQAAALAQQDELLSVNYGPSIQASAEATRAFCAAAEAGNWDGAYACLPISFPAAGHKSKRNVPLSPEAEAAAQRAGLRMKALREAAKTALLKLTVWLDGDSEEELSALRECRPAVQGLMDLVRAFQEAYQREKARRGLVDFSDLEHFTVQLLWDRETGNPTGLAQTWSSRYAQVMVDEYQDTNQVQNAIFTAVSDGGRKLFQVGDVKQSIYRFRLADPTIFLDKYRRYPDGDQAEQGGPRRRILSRNFRSRPQVLLGCNDLFRNIMSEELGELDYTQDQALVPAGQFAEGEDYALELDLLDLSFLGEQAEEEREDRNRLEARWAARRIRALLERPLLVRDGDGERPLRPSDIMILMRSPNVVLPHYLRALSEEGIPWKADGGEDFFSTTEVNVAMALLEVVDNPRQDVPLIAALRSPVYGFSGDQLAMIRAECRDGDFYSALVQAAERGDESCRRFLEELAELRFGAGDRTCRQLIWHMYERTNLLGLFGAMDRGRERQENLLALYALAGELEEQGCRSLFQFLLRLERLQEMGARFSSPGAGREGEGVTLLSIHRSKGLESPVVLVCGLSRKINLEDLKRPVLFHPRLGVGPKGLDRERMVEYPTLARQAVAQQLRRETLSEELRLLYVAMTRAKEKLILSVTLSKGMKNLEDLSREAAAPVPPAALLSRQSVGDWILLHALTRPEAQNLGVAERAAGLAEDLGPAWDLHWITEAQLQPEREPRGRFVGRESTDVEPEEDGESLVQTLTWRYPHQGAVSMPSKLTATQQKGRVQDQEAFQEAARAERTRREPLSRPDFVSQERGLTAAEQGTAIHLAMQYLPLEGDHSVLGIEAELDRLEQGGFLTPLQRRAIDPAAIGAFFASPLGERMLGAQEIHREFKFSVLVSADQYDPELAGEEILLQGVIDCWFAEQDGLTVLDFKSDRIRPGEEPARAQLYRPQMEAYSQALERVTGRRVVRRVLWFFATGRPLEL